MLETIATVTVVFVAGFGVFYAVCLMLEKP